MRKTNDIQSSQTHPSFTSQSNSDNYSTETHRIASIFVNVKEYIISPEWEERKYLGLKSIGRKSMFDQINVRYKTYGLTQKEQVNLTRLTRHNKVQG